VVKIHADAQIPFAPRGAGTGLSGGALALQGAVILELARLNKILKIDYENRTATVETGVINVHLSQATSPHGYHYAPDPSSQMACTIGGNVAENSGGPHCLKYGKTTNHVLLLRSFADRRDCDFEGGGADVPGYDLLCSSDQKAHWHRDQGDVEADAIATNGEDDACRIHDQTMRASVQIIAAGILPAALEMIDRTIRAIEGSIFAGGFPTDVAALLIIEPTVLPRPEETATEWSKFASATTQERSKSRRTLPSASDCGRLESALSERWDESRPT
jgi:hypothetical protein